MANVEHRSTARVLSIFKLLSTSDDGLTLTKISQELNIPKSSLFPIIHTLADQNFLYYNSLSAKYTIGLQSYIIGNSYTKHHNSFEHIVEKMRDIVSECSEICQLGILQNDSVLYLNKVDSPNPIRLISREGKTLPAYCTSLGKALLSDMSFDMLKALYPNKLTAYTQNTVTSLDVLFEQLCETKRTSIALEIEEIHPDISCMAIPLRKSGKIIAAISVSVPSYRFTKEKQIKIRNILLKYKIILDDLLEKTDFTY